MSRKMERYQNRYYQNRNLMDDKFVPIISVATYDRRSRYRCLGKGKKLPVRRIKNNYIKYRYSKKYLIEDFVKKFFDPPLYTEEMEELLLRAGILGVHWLNRRQVVSLVLFLYPYKGVKKIVKNTKNKKLSYKEKIKNLDILKRILEQGINYTAYYLNTRCEKAFGF